MLLHKFSDVIGKNDIVEIVLNKRLIYCGAWSDRPQTIDRYRVIGIKSVYEILSIELE